MNKALSSSHVPIKRIIFWDPCISPHKADFIAAVAQKLPNIEIICIAHKDIPPDRVAMGWSAPVPDRYRQYVAQSDQEIMLLASTKPAETLHIFSGIRWVTTIIVALKAVKKCHARFGIMAEPRVREGLRGKLRIIQSWITEGWFRRNTEFVLAIGRNGPLWFQCVGYSPEKIFPFAYFINSKEFKNISIRHIHPKKLQIGYIGRLIKMKGVDDLLAATALLKDKPEIIIAGIGSQEIYLKRIAKKIDIKTEFRGVIPINEVKNFMSDIDVLILASNSSDDGWGVVVSEALMTGTAVIATNMVGASITLESPLTGAIVPARSPQHISNAIEYLDRQGSFEPSARLLRQQWALSRLSSVAGADYFISILEHCFNEAQRPNPFYK